MKPLVTFEQKGDFKKTYAFFNKIREAVTKKSIFEVYGEKGVAALAMATPRDTGRTAESWYYKIKETESGVSIEWSNSNINHYVSIAVILQYGHATKNGSWVEGRDYINPAIKPVFDEIAEHMRKEVSSP